MLRMAAFASRPEHVDQGLGIPREFLD